MSNRTVVRIAALALSQLVVAGTSFAQQPSDAPAAQPNLAPAETPVTPAPTPATPAPAGTQEGPAVNTPPAAAPVEEVVPKKKRSAEEEIVVTGSRIRRKDLTTPAPVAVISHDQIVASGIASIGDYLQQIPEQSGGVNQNVNNGGDGETQISLRALGADRTLVLVDGKRWVNGGSGAGTAVDLNTIPTSAIERIEILKDGASAVYGSDAIGGVVNIITRKRADGTELSAYYGLTTHGDGNQTDLNVSTGASSDKGGFFFTAGYYDQSSISAGNRDWAKRALGYDFSQCDKDGNCPAFGNFPGGSSRIPQGNVSINPSKCVVDSQGNPNQFCTDLLNAFGNKKRHFMYDPNNPISVDGWRPYTQADAYNYQAVNDLIVPMKRISLFANGDYHITDTIRAYTQASFVNRQSSNLLAPEPFDTGTFGGFVSGQNEFNPFKVDLYDVRRRLVEFGGRQQGFDLDTIHATVGMDGTLPESLGPLAGLFWDMSFNYGRTGGTTTTRGSLDTSKVNEGIGPSFQDANGVWHCGTAAAPVNDPNCVPVNLFGGPGTITPAMQTALGGYEGINTGWTQIATAQFNVSDELFKLASDRAVAIAAGYEYRSEYGGSIPNAIAQQGLDTDYNGKPTVGGFHVNEAYAELDIPIINHVTGIDDLEIQAAGRVFDYSTFGTDFTYKIGARWRPIRDVTFRGTYSTAFRAPAVSDLYGGAGPSAESATDPCAVTTPGSPLDYQCQATAAKQGVNLQTNPGAFGCTPDPTSPTGLKCTGNGDTNVQINSTVGGNPSLKPETANTLTVGVVFEPRWVKGLSLTLDYWSINLSNELGFNTTAVILQGCYPAGSGSTAAQNNEFCNLVQRSPVTGLISNVNDFETNVGQTWTNGVDLSARYSLPTSAGRFGFVLDGTYLGQYDYSVASGFIYHAAGNYDANAGGINGLVTPRFRALAGISYALADFTANLRANYIGSFTECSDPYGGSVGLTGPGFCSNNNLDVPGNSATGADPGNVAYGFLNQSFPHHVVPAYVTFDLSASYTFRLPIGNTTVSAGIRNIMDTVPPLVYQSFLTYADPTYDFYGRFVYGRISHKF